VQSHLDSLGDAEKELCKRASVFSDAFSSFDLASLGITDCEGTLEWLVRRGVLSTAGKSPDGLRRYSFRSSVVLEVAYGMLLDEQRVAAHLSVAQLLTMRSSPAHEDIARHFEIGESDQDAAYWYARAATEAAARGDSDTVLRCAKSALRLAPGVRDYDMHMVCSDGYRFLGMREEQARSLQQAIDSARTPLQRARAMTEYAWNLSRTGQVQASLEMAEAAVDAGRDTGDRECLAQALGWRAVALAQLGRLDDAADAVGEATMTARGSSARVEALAADWRATVSGARGDLAERLLAFSDAQAQYTAVGDLRRAAGAACNVADLYNRLGDFGQAESELRLAREGCRRVNNRLVEGYATANLGYALIRQGRIDEALAELDVSLALANATNETVLRMVVGIYRSRAELGRRPNLEIVKSSRRAADEARTKGLLPLAAMALGIGSSAAYMEGLAELALELAREAMAIRDELGGLEEDEAELFVALARSLEACGDVEAGRRVRARGRERVLAMANGITDSYLRDTYVAVPAHAELLGSQVD
jgi:tetratricopeptide (TPR) repeat protein